MRTIVWIAALLGASSLPLHAAGLADARVLICAPVEAKTCAPAQHCESTTPGEIGAPAFVRIDFDKQVVIGRERTSPITAIDRDDSQILVQGNELGFGWTIAVDVESGAMSASLIDRDGGVVLFGACTPL